MTVLHDTEGWNGFVQELFEAKEKVELQHESLIRHQSGIAATLIGIIAVFGDMSQGSILLRCLTVASVLFLLLTVLAGVLYCFLQYKLKLRALSNCLRQYQEDSLDVVGQVSSPIASWLARIFPWLLCIGILLLSASAVCALLRHWDCFFIIMYFFFHNLMCFENLLLPLQQSIDGMAELRNKLRGRLRCFYSFILLME